MISTTLRKFARTLSSARVATLLIAFVGLWAILASLVPQGEPSSPGVVAWASAHPLAEAVVRAVGLHHAFTAPVFLLCILALALSTAVCAWRRTKVAVARSRTLHGAPTVDKEALIANHDLEIDCDPRIEESAILALASETFGRLGVQTRQRDRVITAASPAWAAWGSPVFHWALLALIVAMPLGSLFRSSGQIGLAVGQDEFDEPASYGILSAGPLHRWPKVPRTIRVDAFDLKYETGGVNRGPTPTVTVSDAEGNVIKSQRVYPNKTLKTGSLTIYPADYGLSATVSVVDTRGAETRRSTELLDFSGKAEGGTTPVNPLVLSDEAGNAQAEVFVSVPLDRVEGGLLAKLPEDPRARVVVVSAEGKPLLDRILRPGEDLVLPTGDTLRLLDLGYYARLQLVDDPSIPVLYASLVIAIIGLGIATLVRQQVVSAAVIETQHGGKLAVRLRLWRNVTSSRTEIETELTQAVGRNQKGVTP